MYLFIKIKPKIIYFIIFYIYCFVGSYYIIRGCKEELININTIIIVLVGGYSFFCTCFLYILNRMYNITHIQIKKNKTNKNKIYIIFLKIFILLTPIIYTFYIHILEDICKCSKSHTLKVAYHIYYMAIVVMMGLIYKMKLYID